MPPVHISEPAERDLLTISNEISNRSLGLAIQFIDAFASVIRQLREFPRSGPLRPELGSDRRVLTRGRWIFIYVVDDEAVEISRIFDGHRDIRDLSRED